MSGATILSIEREFYRLVLSTPRMDFAPLIIPGVTDTATELQNAQRSAQDFHSEAETRFRQYIEEVAPRLDLFMAALVKTHSDEFPLARYVPQAAKLTPYNRKELLEMDTHHCQALLSDLSSVPDVLSDVSVYLGFHDLPSQEMLEALEHRLRQFLNDL